MRWKGACYEEQRHPFEHYLFGAILGAGDKYALTALITQEITKVPGAMEEDHTYISYNKLQYHKNLMPKLGVRR